MNNGYLIIEMNTRAIDGWYANIEETKELYEYLKEEYPLGSWCIVQGITTVNIKHSFRKYNKLLEEYK